MLPTCIVIGCINSIHNQTVRYYKVPIENPNICRQWYINTLREDLDPSSNHHVCIEHFDEESFLNQNQQLSSDCQTVINSSQVLKEDAVPSLFEIEVFQKMIQHQELFSNGSRSIQTNTIDFNAALTNDMSASVQKQQSSSLFQNLINNKSLTKTDDLNDQNRFNRQNNSNKFSKQSSNQNNYCSIKSCINSNSINGDITLYPLPKNAEIAKKWMIACQLHDNELKLCNEHFLQNDFNEFHYLKPDAIPSVFVNSRSKTNNNNEIEITGSTSSAKRSRMDPEERAELLARIPKAMKRTTVQAPVASNDNANKIQKALKHTNSIMAKPALVTNNFNNSSTNNGLIINTNSKFLSAALNNSQTILSSPVKSVTTLSASSNRHHANKGNKAVKHTSATSLLKEILPPPIMQSTKRTPRALKHTNSIMSNSSIIVTASSAVPLSNLKYKSMNAPINSVAFNHHSNTIVNGNNRNDQQTIPSGEISYSSNTSLTHKTTYVYKKINQAPEIELYLECEDDEMASSATNQDEVSQNKSANFISIDKTKLSNSSVPVPINKQNEKFKDKSHNSPLNVKPIGNIINANNKLMLAKQKLNQSLPAEKRYIQTLLKYYSRSDDEKLVNKRNNNKAADYSVKCNLCEKYLNSNIDFISHICSHLEGDNYISPFEAVSTACSVCNSNFDNPFELILHLDTEHLHQLNEYKCRICERQHNNVNELLAHLNTLHTINEMPYRCDVCSFRTSFYADAIHHIKTSHKDTLDYFCPYCLKSVLLPYGDKVQHVIVNNFYSHLITHFNKHENNELIESKCKTCRKCILHVRLMKDHLYNDHSNTSLTASQTINTSLEIDEDDQDSSTRCRPGSNRISNSRKNRIQKAIKSSSGINRNQLNNTRMNSKRIQQMKVLKEHQKPYDQFDLFPLVDEEDDAISFIKPVDFTILIENNADKIKCLECGEGNLETHFQRYFTCHQCRYGTFCSKSYEYHLHGHLMSKRNALWNKLYTDVHNYKCECSFETNDGNLMSSHLLDCEKKAFNAKIAMIENNEVKRTITTLSDDIEMKDSIEEVKEKNHDCQTDKINLN